jgi:hypothetical protein
MNELYNPNRYHEPSPEQRRQWAEESRRYEEEKERHNRIQAIWLSETRGDQPYVKWLEAKLDGALNATALI